MADLGKRLYDALMREADRRDGLGDHAVAHDLRRSASDVASAQSRLNSSQRVRER